MFISPIGSINRLLLNGPALIASKPIELWDDGAVRFTDSAGNRKTIHESPTLNALLAQLIQGGAGVPASKRFHR